MEETVSLGEVYDVDADSLEKVARVLHAKVEPLQVAHSIRVVTHPNVVRRQVLLTHLVHIRALKVPIKRHFLS